MRTGVLRSSVVLSTGRAFSCSVQSIRMDRCALRGTARIGSASIVLRLGVLTTRRGFLPPPSTGFGKTSNSPAEWLKDSKKEVTKPEDTGRPKQPGWESSTAMTGPNASNDIASYASYKGALAASGKGWTRPEDIPPLRPHEAPGDIVPIKKLPLPLIEEIQLPVNVFTEVELVMHAWSQDRAKRIYVVLVLMRLSLVFSMILMIYLMYLVAVASERRMRGVDNMPKDLKIGTVVYFDISCEHGDMGRILIGLFNEKCPIYSEYFHRMCTGQGGKGPSFRGLKVQSIVHRHAILFGEGTEMEHCVPGFHPNYLPTESDEHPGWKGCLSAISYGPQKESPNFAFHITSGEYNTQVFGMVLGGMEVLDQMHLCGTRSGSAPKREFYVEGCGELCTLDKANLSPMPWRLYESIPPGYDESTFGERSSPVTLEQIRPPDPAAKMSHLSAREKRPKFKFI